MASNYNYISVKFARAEQPKFEERRGQGYIQYGENNNYPDYLLNLYRESSKHGSIIKGKANYIYGKGFNIPDNLKANVKGDTWNNIFKKAVKDDEIFCGYYLQIIYNLEGKIKDVYHIDFKKVRTNKEQSKFYVKNDWTDLKEKARIYPAFNNIYDKENPSQILFVKQYNPGDEVYPTPNYFQALNYIESDVQVSRHILGNAKDGFVATTAINLNNGEPDSEEQKEQVERDIKKKFTGSEGDRVLIFFNKSKETGAEVIPLSQTMLTKEDFTNINNLIQQEIFAGHQITSPMLFGIKTEGQLGGRTEIQDSYEIFNNTYVNERQQAHEEVFNRLLSLKGDASTYTITPVEPLGFTLKEDLLLDIMPREYFLDKLGVDVKYYSLPPARSTGAPMQPVNDVSGTMAVNENLAGMSGRKFQQLERIVRKFKSGKLTREQAAMMLKGSFGVTDDEVALFLDADSNDHQFASQDEIDFALIEQFSQVGESKEMYEELSRKDAIQSEYFADVQQLSQLESNILNLIKKDKRVTPEVLATVLKQDVAVIQQALTSMEEAGLFTVKVTTEGQDEIPERTVANIGVKGPKPTTTEILLRYSYDGPKDDRNRPFCAKLMELDRLYSRADIELISERLGYSVWDRKGGWLTMPDGSHRPECRHRWFALTVVRKKD